MKDKIIPTKDIYVDRIPHSGMLVLSAIVDGQRVVRKYIGHTKAEAIADFAAHRIDRNVNVICHTVNDWSA